MECTAEITFQGEARGEARLGLSEEALSVSPRRGGELYYSLRDILAATAGDYRIGLRLAGGDELVLAALGYRYEDFLRELHHRRNELILGDLLMEEKLRRAGVKADLAFVCADGREAWQAPGEIRLYETGLVVLPETAELLRIPYAAIEEIGAEDYRLAIRTEDGARLDLTGLGYEFEPLAAALAAALAEMERRAQSLVKELAPRIAPAALRKVTGYFREGRAARRGDLERDCPDLWPALEARVAAAGLGEEYSYLRQRAWAEGIRVGFKRGLLGDLTGDYFWFLFPLYGADPRAPGNAVAMEAFTAEAGEQGRATYFFRLAGRAEYAAGLSPDELASRTEEFLPLVARGLVEINFRREPIYLTDEELAAPEHRRYWFARERLPALRRLRAAFIGRVIHLTPEQWQKDADALLRFNVTAATDEERWRKKE